jgi:hypothetical protein
VPSIDSLEEICDWLGTFRERLRVAREGERAGVAAVVESLEARFQLRRSFPEPLADEPARVRSPR